MKKDFSKLIFRYVFEFAAAGFVGWIYEVATVWVMFHCYDNRGILHLPIIPIYAAGAFILLILLRKKRNPVFIFFFSMIITTVFELISSYVLEFIFHRQFWTYKNWYLSILDRSSLVSSAIFGFLAVVYFWGLHPISEKLSEKLPKTVRIGFSTIISAAILIDFVISVKDLLI